jgi:hypothetical protein
MPARAASSHRSRQFAHAGWAIAGVAVLLIGIWSVTGPDARGSDVLIVIEDASPTPTGLFPGTVCYKVVRNSDSVTVSEGCLAVAASISAPAGFDRGMMYTIEVTVNHASCTVLDDVRTGTGAVPFRVRVACQSPNEARTDAADSTGPDRIDRPFAVAGASPVAVPITTRP